jgi:hypothetical protein
MRVPFLLVCLSATLGIVSPVAADVPDPSCSIAPPAVTITPDGTAHFDVVARVWSWADQACHPVANAFIEIEFSPEADNLIAWAPGQPHPIVSGIADAEGKFSFTIRGAGCVPKFFPGQITYTTQIRYNGIVINEVGINSPDVVNNAGKLPLDLGHNICENGITQVSLSDAIFHTAPIKMGLVEECSRFTGPVTEPVTLADALFLTPYIKAGVVLTCQ